MAAEMTESDQPLSYVQIITNLDNQIAILEYQLERLRTLRWALEDSGTFQRLTLAQTYTWEEICQQYQERGADTEIRPSSAPRKPTRFDTIARFFQQRENQWATAAQIADGTKIRASIVRDVLYKSHKEKFERENNPEGRGKIYRLNQNPAES